MQRFLLVSILFTLLFSTLAIANPNARQVIIPAAPQLSATAYLLIDANSGRVLAEKNADKALPPASITKLMTSYIVSSEIERGAISHSDQVPISVTAWKKGGSKAKT